MKTGIVFSIENDTAVVMLTGGKFVSADAKAGWRKGDVVSIESGSFSLKALSAAAACFLFLLLSGFGGFKLYYTEVSTISIDINPSIEMGVNRFDRVIRVSGYNDDSRVILDSVSLVHKPYGNAVGELLTSESLSPYFAKDEVHIKIAVQSDIPEKNEVISSALNHEMESLPVQQAVVVTDVEVVSHAFVTEAREHELTPGKYSEILELKDLEPDTDIEEFRDLSIREIRAEKEKAGIETEKPDEAAETTEANDYNSRGNPENPTVPGNQGNKDEPVKRDEPDKKKESVKTHTVKFDSKGGNKIASQRVEQGGLVGRPADPARSGYIFAGWYHTIGRNESEFNFYETTVTSNITLMARWTPIVRANEPAKNDQPAKNDEPANKSEPAEKNEPAKKNEPVKTYTVKFDSKGGNKVTSQKVEQGGLVGRPADPSRNNYIFAGWYHTIGRNESEFNFYETTITSNITLTARWTPAAKVNEPAKNDQPAKNDEPTKKADPVKTYTIKFDSKGGNKIDSQKVEQGGLVSKPADPTRSGYTFAGWYNAAGHNESEFDFYETTVTGNITLTAKWTQAARVNEYGKDDQPAKNDERGKNDNRHNENEQ